MGAQVVPWAAFSVMARNALVGALARRARHRPQAQPKARVMKKKVKVSHLCRRNRSGLKSSELRTLSICCPELAVAILAKQKNIENRTWQLPATVQDAAGHAWLALHVGCKKRATRLVRKHLLKAWDPDRAHWPWNKMKLSQHRTGAPLPRAAIVGLIRVKQSRKLKPGEKKENPWALGPICWEIDRAITLDSPIENVNGSLGLWSVDRESSISSYSRRRLYAALRAAKAGKGIGCFRPK